MMDDDAPQEAEVWQHDDDSDDESEEVIQHHSHHPGPLVSRDGCTAGRYATWLIQDANRATADELRIQKSNLNERDAATTAVVHERRRVRTQELRQSQLKAEQAVREVKNGYASRGVSQRQIAEEQRRVVSERQRAFLTSQREGAVKRHGEEQRKKTMGARSEIFEKRAMAVQKARDESRASVARTRALLKAEADAKRAGVAQVRKQTALAGLQGAGFTVEAALGRNSVLKERKAAADAVRGFVEAWERQRKKEDKVATKAAKAAHNEVMGMRNNAQKQRDRCERIRRRDANLIRQDLQRMEETRQTLVLATAQSAKAMAQTRYDLRFASDEQAEQVAASASGAQDLIISDLTLLSNRAALLKGPTAEGADGDEGNDDDAALES